MAITVQAHNLQVSRPVQVHLRDRSGAHTELTLFVSGEPPISQAFDYTEGDFTVLLDLIPGQYVCRLFVQAYDYKALNPMYDVSAAINGQPAGSASGSIPPRGNDSGFDDFTLTVV